MPNPDEVSRFNEIYNETGKNVLTFVTSKCRCTADISDIVQDTYMELYQVISKHGTKHIKNSSAFVMRIAKRKLAKHYSKSEHLRVISVNTTNEDGENVDLSDFEADVFLLEDFAVNQVMIESARKLIKQKPEDVKKVFYLYYDLGLTIPEVAKALSIKESSVKNKLYRTLKELRSLLT